MAISGTDKALMFCVSGLARSGATRSNYVGTGVFISIGGVEFGDRRANKAQRVLRESLTITDTLNEDPNTCAMTCKGFEPSVGAEVIIRLGSTHNGSREFAGHILQTTQAALVDDPMHHGDTYNVAAIDYTWGLNRRKVTARYTGTATAIAQALITEWAPTGYSSAAVAPGLPLVEGGITFTHQDLTDCLTQLAKRIGASWFIDYQRALHLFFEDTSATDPMPLTLTHPTARELAIERDVSQWVTRALVEAGGVAAITEVPIGETLLPVETTVWYPPGGGQVSAGPQHLRYGGIVVGNTGALVGTGAQPSGGVTTAPAVGGAIPAGVHGYAFTYETAAGESLPGPTTNVNVGDLAPPSSAPTIGAPILGAGPDPGTHEYAVAFLTADGGTSLVGPRVSVSTGLSAAPAAPTTPTATLGTGLPYPATFDYAVSFRTSIGETTVGPVSAAVATAAVSTTPPATAPTPSPTAGSGLPVPASFDYAVTFLTATGETTIGAASAAVSTSGQIANAPAPGLAGTGPNSTQGDLIPGNFYGYAVSWSTAPGQTTHSEQTGLQFTLQARAEASTANAAKSSHILVDVPFGPPGVLWCHLYRVNQTVKPGNNPPDFRLLASFSNAVAPGTVRFTDTIADSAIAGALAGSGINTTPAFGKVSLTSLPKGAGGTGVTGRRVYRRQAGGAFGLVYDFAGDNVTTSFVDALATPGAAPPATNTATGTPQAQVTLTNLPKGGSGSGVIGRRVYRRGAGWGFVLVLDINDNTTTTAVDAAPGPINPVTTPLAVSTAALQQFVINNIPVGGPLVTDRNLYRTAANSPTLQLLTNFGNNATTSYLDQYSDAYLGALAPTAPTAAVRALQIGAIAVGPSAAGGAVIARRLYRTAANLAQLKLLARLADNVTTTYLDALADAALGANAPAADTSGLKQPEGSVNAGATSMPVSGAGWAPPGGGWVIIGNGAQVIRYAAVSGNTLVGIPPSGPGAITATIAFNSSVTAAPMLTGIPATGGGSIRVPLIKGDDVNLLIILDDTASQAALAALIGGDGVQEEFLQDRRLSYAEAVARAEALLALRGQLVIGVHFTSRDLNSHAGRLLRVDLGAPFNLRADLRIQRSTATFTLAGHPPLYSVEASTARFSFEDLLRMARLTRGT